MKIRIDHSAAMAHGETRVFDFPRNGRTGQGFVIRYHASYYAYLNMCCHWPVPMDMGDNDFYYAKIDRITCKTHGATYLPETGVCDSGPCVNGRLDSYPVEVFEDYLLISVPD